MSSLKNIIAKSQQLKDKKECFSSKFEDFITSITLSLKGLSISGQSENCTQECKSVDGDDFIYGHLSYDNDEISVFYRDTDDDIDDSLQGVPKEYQYYRKKSITECSHEWKKILSSEAVLSSLLKSLQNSLEMEEREIEKSIDALTKHDNYLNNALESETVQEFQNIKIDSLLEEWKKARQLIQIDPYQSLGLTSNYLETI
jgi:hypothetical protein